MSPPEAVQAGIYPVTRGVSLIGPDLCHLTVWNVLRHGQTHADNYLAKDNRDWRRDNRPVTWRPAGCAPGSLVAPDVAA